MKEDNSAPHEYRPILLVNPGLEMIVLEGGNGHWHPVPNAQFRAAGLVPPGPELRIEQQPVAGAVAHLSRGEITVTVTTPPRGAYQAHARPEILGRARELRGVLLMVTHTVEPGELTL